MNETAKEAIKAGKAVLGIEFGSTRIKAVLVDEKPHPHRHGNLRLGESSGEQYLDL